VEDLLVDIYFWFVHSTKRKCELAEYADFCDQGYCKIIKHVSTGWLIQRFYLLFLQSALQIFVNLNLFLQKEEVKTSL